MKNNKHKKVLRYIGIGALAVLIMLLALLPKLSGVDKSSVAVEESVISATAEKSDIISTFSGGGILADEEGLTVSVPGAVAITGYAVENNDFVEAGGAIAYTDKSSVMNQSVELQSIMSELDAKLATLNTDESGESIISAPVAGRVMAIYAESGVSVVDTMYEHSSLMLLSIDGLLALDVDAGELKMGDTLTFTLTDGTTLPSTVARVRDGVATVTVSDELAPLDESVTVTDASGKKLGEGELYIHSELKVTAYEGTVSSLWVSVGSYVTKGRTLMTVTGVNGDKAERTALLAQREKLQEQMAQLFQMYQNGYVSAVVDGYVSGIDKNASYNQLSAGTGEAKLMWLANNPVGAPDESGFVNIAYKVTAVSFGSISAKTSSVPLGEVDYAVPSVDESSLTDAVTLSPTVPVYTYENGAWTTGDASSITVGDLLILANAVSVGGDGNSVVTPLWITRTPSQDGDSDDTDPSGSPGGNSASNGNGGFASGGVSGFASGRSDSGLASSGEEQESYAVADTAICTLTPADTVTISVSVDELDILSLSIGQQATVTLDALGGQSFEGTVTAVNKVGANEGGSTKYSVEITLPRTSQMLSGMNASVTVKLDITDGVVTVPVAALTENGSHTYVYTEYDKRKDILGGLTEVKTGVSDGEMVEIVSGLNEGDTVCYRYAGTMNYNFK